MAERLNSWLENLRAHVLTGVFRVWNKLRVYLLAFASSTVDLQANDVCAQLIQKGNQRMDGGSLSFFDDFVVVDGIPVFHLNPKAARGLRKESTEITCWVMSHDGTRTVTGHKNGSILLWDSTHGRLDSTYESVFDGTIAAMQFCREGNRFLVACTFVGNFATIDLDEKKVVRSSCSSFWEENRADVLYNPIVHWPAFSRKGKYLVYPVKVAMQGEQEKLNAHCFVYIFTASEISEWGEWPPVDISKEYLLRLDIPLQADIRGYDVAAPSFSHDETGFLIGCNSLSNGYVVAWPDFVDDPEKSFHLKGSIGKWGRNNLVVTWYTPLSTTTQIKEEYCYVWNLNRSWRQSSVPNWSHHPHYKISPERIREPDGNPIVWCDFVERQESVSSLVTASRGNDMRIVIWDSDNVAPFRIISTGISYDQTLLTKKDMWDKKWIDQNHVPGLQLFSVSHSGSWIAVYSHIAGAGSLWDAKTGFELVRFSDMNQRDATKHLGPVDIEFSGSGNKFAMCGSNMIVVWNPRALDSEESQGVHATALESDDLDPNTGDLICHFSADGDTIGLLRPFSTVLNIWNLKFGSQAMVSLEKGRGPVDLSSLGFMTPSRMELLSEEKSCSRSSRICEFALSDTGHKLVTCMADMSVIIWEGVQRNPGYAVVWKIIGEIRSKCYPAWAVCFSKTEVSKPCVVVCEDTGWLVWLNVGSGRGIERKNAYGKRYCKFNSDGSTAVLMPDLQNVYVWDLVRRKRVHKLSFAFWLGGGLPDFPFHFPFNVAMSGMFTCVGINSSSEGERKPVVYQTGASSPVQQVTETPRNILLSENCQWLVADELVPVGREDCQLEMSEMVAETSSVDTAHQQDSGRQPKYPEILPPNENRWAYIWNKAKLASKGTDSLVVMSLGGSGTEKTIVSKGLDPNRCMAMSRDGRRIACLRKDSKLLVFDAYATEGCIPDRHSLHVAGLEEDQDCIESLLEKHGPSILNYPDFSGMTILFHAAAQKNYLMLQWLLQWAADTDHKAAIQAPPRYKQAAKKQNALKIALDCRSPECTQTVLNYLLEARSHGSATAEVFKESLVYLARVYPRLFFQALMHKEMLYELSEVSVHEHVFARSRFKVTSAEHMMVNTKSLEDLWVQNSQRGAIKTLRFKPVEQLSQKMIPARPYVVTYPWIAKIGRDGILQQLLLYHAPYHIYGYLPLRCVINLKWKLYAQKLLREEIMHYALLLILFTSYSYNLGFTRDSLGVWEVLRGSTGDHSVAATVFIFLSAVVSSGSLVREMKQIGTLRKDAGWRGIGYWVVSPWNWVELCSYILVTGVIPVVHYIGGHPNLLTSLVATTSILLWSKMLYYAQAFKVTGGKVVMIKEIVKDMRFFLIMAFSVLFGFGNAFFVLFRSKRFEDCLQYTDDELEKCEDMKDRLHTTFNGPGRSLLAMFGWMLGELQVETLFLVDGSIRAVAVTLFIFYVMTLSIVLLNLLIAIMGDSYDRVKNTEDTKFLKERAMTILDMELMLSDKRKEAIQKKIGKFVHVLFPKYKQTPMQEPEWQGRIRDIHKSVRREVHQSTDRVLQKINELDQRQQVIEEVLLNRRRGSRSSIPRVPSVQSHRWHGSGTFGRFDLPPLSNIHETRRQSIDDELAVSPRSPTFLEDRNLESPSSDEETFIT